MYEHLKVTSGLNLHWFENQKFSTERTGLTRLTQGRNQDFVMPRVFESVTWRRDPRGRGLSSPLEKKNRSI